jgi:hypothetical protein
VGLREQVHDRSGEAGIGCRIGGDLKTYEIQVSADALTRYGLSIGDVFDAATVASLGFLPMAVSTSADDEARLGSFLNGARR